MFRAIVGVGVLLGALFGVLLAYWGAGPVLFEIPWYIPTMHSFMGLAAFCVAYLALGRYQVLRDPAAYWIGIGFAAFGIESIFFILTWPGLLPGNQGVIARLPNTSGWIALLELSSISLFLLAAVLARWPGGQALAGRRWLGSVAAWLLPVTLLASLAVLFEQNLPLLVGPQGNLTPLLLTLDWLFMALFAIGAILSTRRYLRSADTFLGYVGLTQVVLAFVVLTALIGARRYDLWYYLSRILLVGGFLTMMFGLLSEYVQLFRRERDKTREVRARSAELLGILQSSPDAVFVIDKQGGIRFASQAALDLLRVKHIEELSRPAGEWAAAYEIRDRTGRQLSGEELPLARVGRGETIQGEEFQFGDLRTGSTVWVLISAGPLRDEAGQPLGGILVGTDITGRKQAEEEQRTNEQKLRTLFEILPVGVSILDRAGHVVETNPALQQLLAFSGQELAAGLYRQRQYLRFDRTPMPPDEFPTALARQEQRSVTNIEVGIVKEDGETIWTNVSAVPVALADWRVITAVADITRRKRAEQQVSRLSRLYATLSQINQAIVRAKERVELYQTICRVAVDYGEFSLAWIGLLDEESGEVRPVATAGGEADPLPFQEVNVKQAPFDNSLVGLAIREARVVTSEDIQTDPRLRPWQKQAIAGGYHAEAAVPFQLRGRTMGVLNLYAREAGFFTAEEELGLLAEIALDISFALDRLETQAEHQQAEEAVRASLQEKELLLREIQHRVRNNLQAIFNLLYLQAGYVHDPHVRQMFQDTQARVKSIALVHEKLYQTPQLTDLNFAGYLSSLAQHLIYTYGVDPRQIHVTVTTEAESMDLDTAVPLGIIVNELFSNALKHAFPGGRPGEIRIELREEDAGWLNLTLSDNGVGFPEDLDPTTPHSLGLQLVRMLSDHMRGQIEVHQNNGTTFIIRFSPVWGQVKPERLDGVGSSEGSGAGPDC